MPTTNRLKVLQRFKNTVVHSYAEGELLFSSRNRILSLSNLEKSTPVEVARIPWKLFQYLSCIRLIDRVLKHAILQVFKINDGSFLVSNGSTFWHIRADGTIQPISQFSSTRPMNRGICQDINGTIYVAEYLANPKRGKVRVYKSQDCSTFEVAWTFEPGTIRHIHALIPDPENLQRIWVLTGDSDQESHIFYTDDSFESLHCFLSAGQSSRSTDLIIREGVMYWGMDTPLADAWILKAHLEQPEKFEKLHAIPGPAYYMTQNAAGAMYMGSTAEPGPAVKDKCGHLFATKPDATWEELLSCQTDWVPQHGIFYFPRGVLPENYLIYSQRGLKPNEGTMTIARDLSWE